MTIAFYAPLKPPNHWRPSGDRQLARLFAQALGAAGYAVELASTFRSWEGVGDSQAQSRDAERGAAVARQLITRCKSRPASRPRAWFTYHAYHKAPDWIGPPVCRALAIPYLLAEASIAHKQARGQWQSGYDQTRLALETASAVFSLSPDDEETLRTVVPAQALFELAPFMIPPASSSRRPATTGATTRLVATAMMRPGDKLASFRQLAAVLNGLPERDWQLSLIGDGKARGEVEKLFAPFGKRITFLGELDAPAIARHLDEAELFVWPAVNEALGMAILEAHAHGLPVVAGYTPGVSRIVADGETGVLCAAGDTDAMTQALRRLLDDPAERSRMSVAARQKFNTSHTLDAAARTLRSVIEQVLDD